MEIDEALDFEARMQAECMMTNDFERAYTAFVSKTKPQFEGN
jgi:enoyl-CoA hydratase/carnithine racemase